MQQITVSGFSIDIVRKNIKNMHLAVYPPTGRVRIAVPLRITDEAIRLFAVSKIAWIRKNQRAFATQERQSPREFIERESHYFKGKRYLLKIIEVEGTPKVEIKNTSNLILFIKPGSDISTRRTILNEWYRQELKKAIPTFIEKWEKTMGVNVNEWQVKQMKTKWGTCNIEAKRIWLNLELAKKPEHCLEYIIVHEMVHLLVRHHNDEFVAYMNKFMPNWKQYKTELNRLPISHKDWEY